MSECDRTLVSDQSSSPSTPPSAVIGESGWGGDPLRLTGAGRIDVLDGLRGVAILLVMVYHFVLYGGWRPEGLLEWGVYRLANVGWIGVDLFFVLSGFLITGVLWEAKGGGRFFRSFYARRFLRIFPLYYGFIACYFLFAPMVFPQGAALRDGQMWYWTYLLNVDIALHGWPDHFAIAHFWSLAVEEQFYLLWPLVVWLSGRRSLLRICVLCVFAAVALRMLVAVEWRPVAAYVLMPTRIDSLAIGGWLAIALRSERTARWVARWDARAVGLGLLFLAATLVRKGRVGTTDLTVVILGYTVIAVMFAGALHLALRKRPSWLAGPTLRLFGRYSYALYVIHHPLILLLAKTPLSVREMPRGWGSQIPAQIVVILVAGALSVGFAALSWRFWELPFLRLKRLFPYRPAREGRA